MSDFVGEDSFFGQTRLVDNGRCVDYLWGCERKRLWARHGSNVSFDAGFVINGTLVPFIMTANFVGYDNIPQVHTYIKNGA